jgi:tRNA pseudouridine55 synthase
MSKENFLLIKKPTGWTSHDVVAYLRRQYPRGTKIGHAGTLDPFATGLLIIGVGRDATKRLDEFKNLPKIYEAVLFLGAISDTQDKDGTITSTGIEKKYTEEEIKKILETFIGPQLQIPPMYSAKKINGKKLYDLARQGIEVERKPSAIEIYNIELLNYNYPHLKIRVGCSTGTYIRTLGHDIGQKLGCGAYCAELVRTKIGQYALKNAQEMSSAN